MTAGCPNAQWALVAWSGVRSNRIATPLYLFVCVSDLTETRCAFR